MAKDNNIEEIYKYIQQFIDENTLVTIGSGISSAEGIPGMKNLASELGKEIPNRISSSESDIYKWNKIKDCLDKGSDLETALTEIQASDNLDNVIKHVTYDYIRDFNMSILSGVLNGKRSLKIISLLNHLMPRDNKELVIITTNYDCLIEYACAIAGIDVDTLFYGTTIKRYQPDLMEKQHNRIEKNRRGLDIRTDYNFVKLLKPHGSLDWHSTPKDEFVNASIYSPDTVEIITPGISKFRRERREPYNRIYNICNQEIDMAKRYLFLGYGFNDHDLQDHYEQNKNKGKPMLVVTKDLTDNICSLYNETPTIMLVYQKNTGTNIKYKHSGTETTQYITRKLWDIETLTKEVLA